MSFENVAYWTLNIYFVIDNKAILFFFRLALNAFPAIWSVGRIEKKKKKTKKKSQEVSEKEALVPQDDVRS